MSSLNSHSCTFKSDSFSLDGNMTGPIGILQGGWGDNCGLGWDETSVSCSIAATTALIFAVNCQCACFWNAWESNLQPSCLWGNSASNCTSVATSKQFNHILFLELYPTAETGNFLGLCYLSIPQKKQINVIYSNGCKIKNKKTLPAVRRQHVSRALLAAKARDFATSFSFLWISCVSVL